MSQERGQKKYKAFQLSISITEPEPSVQEVLKPLRLEVDRLQACAMTVRIFLLVSAVAQLASPALLPHTQQPEKRNVTDFKNIHDVVEKCISSPSKDFFVDDITHLTEGENACGDRFFCKAHNILHAHRNFCEHTNRDRLVRTLEAYIKNRNVQCDNATTSDEIKMSKVLQSVSRCARQRLFRIPS